MHFLMYMMYEYVHRSCIIYDICTHTASLFEINELITVEIKD